MPDDPKPTPATAQTAAPAAQKPGDPVILEAGTYAMVPMTFVDDYVSGQLGPMSAPAAGVVTVDQLNIVAATASVTAGVPAQAFVRIDALNAGKAVVSYRLDNAAVDIPVEVVRRVPKAVTYDPNGVTRATLP